MSPEAIEALVSQSGPEESRLATLDHVMACAACKAEFDLMQSFAGSGTPGRRFTVPWAAAASIGLLLAAGAWYVSTGARQGSDQTLRGTEAGIELVAPKGDGTGQPVSFVWRAVPGATRYTLEVFNATGDAVFTTEVSDTSVSMTETTALVPGEIYYWWLVIRKSDGTEARSATQSFKP
jgi:hypothetical protein